MENISINQALSVWSELWQAYYGKNDFGSDTAEIYAYKVMPRCPILETSRKKKYRKDEAKEYGLQAAQSLYALLVKFSMKNECIITVNGRRLGKWFLKEPFLHRCHVKVIVL